MHSFDPVGEMLPTVAAELGIPPDAVVLCGGNDAALAAWSGGLADPGDANIISGTCDIANVCTAEPVASAEFNVRAHVLPGRWLTFFVLNTGGVAYDWFHSTMCREMDDDEFYGQYLPATLEAFLADPDIAAREASLPSYEPFLGGSRYSLAPLHASYSGVDLRTTREDLLLAMVRGNLRYLGGTPRAGLGPGAGQSRPRHLRWGCSDPGHARSPSALDRRLRLPFPGPIVAARRGHARADPPRWWPGIERGMDRCPSSRPRSW